MFKCVSFATRSFLSFKALGHLVKTEYMRNHATECEVCVTFNVPGYVPWHALPSFSFCVKGEYRWILDENSTTPMWTNGKSVWINEYPHSQPCCYK